MVPTFADKWFGDGRTSGQWRDTAAFTIARAEATGELLTRDGPASESAIGEVQARDVSDHDAATGGLLHTPPTLGITRAERFLSLTIAAARERLYDHQCVFRSGRRVSTADSRRGPARRRPAGADGRSRTDVRTMWCAGRARYTSFFKSGVSHFRIRAGDDARKTFVVDGSWLAIGSMNFDNRSMLLNDEAGFVALDPAIGRRLEELFATDTGLSKEVTLNEFRRRSWSHKSREWIANLLTRVL